MSNCFPIFRRLLLGLLLPAVFMVTSTELKAEYDLKKMGQWSDEEIPPYNDEFFSNVRYNDLWGYVDDDGNEFAIIGSVEGTHFIDVTDPENPEQVDKVEGRFSPATHRDFHTHEGYAYATADQGESSLQIMDLQHLPDSVEKVYDNDSLMVRAHNNFIENDRLYLAIQSTHEDVNPMAVLSLEDPARPSMIHELNEEFEFPYNVHDVHVQNDTAYCSAEFGGLFIYDMEDPKNPHYISSITNYPDQGYNHSGWLNDEGNRYVFSDEVPEGLRLKYYDISDIENPELLDVFGLNHELGSTPHNPFIKDSLIYVSYYHNGVVVFDKSNPENIEKLAQYDTYPQNINDSGEPEFEGLNGAWGVYPFLPSGTIIASDMTNGLFTLSLEEKEDQNPGTAIAENRQNGKEEFEVYPNPFNEKIKIEPKGQVSESISVKIKDLNGRVLEKKPQLSAQNDEAFKLNPENDLAKGVYLLKIREGEKTYTKKIVKQ